MPACLILFSVSPAFAQWEQQASGTTVQLRGVSAVSPRVAWASGAQGTVLRTVDGGARWEKRNIAGAEQIDFRDIQAFDSQTAFVLGAGPGEQSRIYKTSDGGKHWRLQFTNHAPQAFYDCFAFWDATHGIALSDSVEGRFPLMLTTDGQAWKPLAPSSLPPALPQEGAFAASGTCIATVGKNDVWFVTGGPAARVFHSADRGDTWKVAPAPIVSGMATQGIFSITFSDRKNGVIVGGDYKEPRNAERNAAVTTDGGVHWLLAHGPAGYRSAVAFIPGTSPPTAIAVGTTGSDASRDAGQTWQSMDTLDYNAVSFAGPHAGWAVGPQGRIARFLKLPQ